MASFPVGFAAIRLNHLPTTILPLLILLASLAKGFSANIRALNTSESSGRADVRQGYGQVPLHFEANQGQVEGETRFLSRGPGYSLFLRPSEVVMALRRGQNEPVVLRLGLAGANSRASIGGQEELPCKVNCFHGNDPGRWRTNIPTFRRVKYDDIYPGVDLVFYGNQRRLEYDFIVAPGVDPGAIRLSISGAREVALDAEGNLVCHTASGAVLQRAPYVYQDVNGSRQRVFGRYVLLPQGKAGCPQPASRRGEDIAPDQRDLSNEYEVGFEIGSYDRSLPLIIDPVLSYSTYLGGGGTDGAYSIAVDAGGHAYVTGYTDSLDFPGATPSTNFVDIFIAKLNPSGTALLYATYIGGNYYDYSHAIAVDAAGNAYVAGRTSSTNFPTMNPFQVARPRGSFYEDDAFVLKLNPTGSGLVYCTYLGGSEYEYASGIAVDSTGHAYVTGLTSSTNFPTANPLQSNLAGGVYDYDTFITKFSPSGSNLVYSTFLGGYAGDSADAIAVDSAGNAYVTGSTSSTNFPTANAWQGARADVSYPDAFVSKINSNGSALVFSTYLGGGSSDRGAALAVDPLGNVYVTGTTYSTNFPTVNALQPAIGGITNAYGQYASDAFITKFNSNGSALIYSTYLGGSAADGGTGIAVDGNGRTYVTGNIGGPPSSSPGDAFAVRVNTAGSALDDLIYLGGCREDVAYGIALDPAGNAYITGYTSSTDFSTVTPFQSALRGQYDAFVAKVGLNGPLTNQPPRIFLSTSVPDGVASAPASFELDAAVTDLGGQVMQVRFFQGTNVVATVTNAPYMAMIENLPVGEYRFTAAATDNQAASATSCPLTILVVPPPANDNFSDRIPISGAPLTVTGSNRGATLEPNEPEYEPYYSGRQTVWWSWTAPTNGSFTISTEGSDFRTVLAIYSGTDLAALSLVAGNAYGGSNGTSKASLQAVAGMTYEIQVDGLAEPFGPMGRFGNIVLSFTYHPPPPNDDFANRIPLAGLNVTTTGSNLGATKEPGEPDHIQSYPPPPGRTVWWTWTAPTNGSFTFSAEGSSFAPVLAIYTGSTLLELTRVDAAVLYGSGFNSRLILQTVAGNAYQIVIDNYVGGSPGDLTLTIQYHPPPANDNFADRIVLTGGYPLSWTGSNLGATRETNEPSHHLYIETRQSVWWSWTAPTSGVFSIDSAGSSFEPIITIYTGEELLNLIRVAPAPPAFPPRRVSSEELPTEQESGQPNNLPRPSAPVFPAGSIRLFFEAEAGTTYQIAIDNTDYVQGGDIMLALAYHPPPPNDDFADRIPLTGNFLTTTGSNLGATREMDEPSHSSSWPYGDAASIWWWWTPPTNGWYTMTTDGSSFYTLLAVYTGTAWSNLVVVAKDAGAGATNGGSKITAHFDAGTVYQIVVASVSNTRGDVRLNIRPANPPTNDNFANRITLGDLPVSFSGSNVDATKEPGEPFPASTSGGASIWWSFTAPSSGVFKLTAEGNNFAPVIGIYTGTILSNLTEITSRWVVGFPGYPLINSVLFRAQAGMTCHILIDSYSGRVGDVNLSLEQVIAPANDDFGNRIPLLGNSATVSGSNSNATHEIGEPSPFYSSAGSVWWSWSAGGDAQVTLSADGNGLYLVLGVYSGSVVSNLTLIASDVFSGSNGASVLTFQALAGQTYHIAVEGAYGMSGDFVLSLNATGPPFNDLFANSIALSGAPVTTTGHNIGATAEPGEPWHGENFGGASVWWSWTAPSNGYVTLTTKSSQFETLLAVYTGLAVSNLTSAGQPIDRDTVFLPVNEGVTYRIAVDGNYGATGQILLQLDYTTPPPNDDFADRIVLSGTDIDTQGSNFAATKEPGEPDHGGDAGSGSVWWSWTAPVAGKCFVGTSDGEFLIGIYTGGVVSNLTTIAGSRGLVEFDGVGGQTYHVAIDSYPGSMGSFNLGLKFRPLPANDFFVSRTALYGHTIRVTANNVDATREPGEPFNGDFYGERSLWWSWAPPFSGNFTVSVESTGFESLLSIYTGSALSSLTLIAESTQSTLGGPLNLLSFEAVAGKTYQIAVDSYSGAGSFALNISPTPPPVNDHFANRIPIPPLTLSLTASTVNATKESAEPNHAGMPGGKSVWWSWTAPFSGPARISTSGSFFDTLLAVYTGATYSSLNLIASDDDSGGNSASLVQFQAVAGTTYQIAVDGFGGASGFVVLNLAVDPEVKLTPLGLTNGQFYFRITGPVERQINVERSDNLSDWTSIWSVWMTGYTADLEDLWTAGWTNLFYRAWRDP